MKNKADFTGFIAEMKVDPATGNGTIRAESHADKLVHRCRVDFNTNTSFYRWNGKESLPISYKEVQFQDKIRVWFVTPSADAYPEEGLAKKVIVATGLPLDIVN